jgi:hypothetical protein
LADGALSEKFYKEKLAEFKGKELKELNDNSDVMAAVRETYGASATMDD